MIMKFATRYSAQKHSRTMIGWNVKVFAEDDYYIIQCNGVKYLMADGFVR